MMCTVIGGDATQFLETSKMSIFQTQKITGLLLEGSFQLQS
jgi:hypothetical protein